MAKKDVGSIFFREMKKEAAKIISSFAKSYISQVGKQAGQSTANHFFKDKREEAMKEALMNDMICQTRALQAKAAVNMLPEKISKFSPLEEQVIVSMLNMGYDRNKVEKIILGLPRDENDDFISLSKKCLDILCPRLNVKNYK